MAIHLNDQQSAAIETKLKRIERNVRFVTKIVSVYEETLNQIAAEPKNSRARRNARSTIEFVESLRGETKKSKAQK